MQQRLISPGHRISKGRAGKQNAGIESAQANGERGAAMTRRVVIGDVDGVSSVVSDAEVEPVDFGASEATTLWRIDSDPAVPNGGAPATPSLAFPGPGGVWVSIFVLPPRATATADSDLVDFDPDRSGHHATDTIDIDYVLSGSVVLEVDGGREIELHAGDSVVVNGNSHAWHNRTDQPLVLMATMVGAQRIAG
jgi:quercetin dioxygenase-like cupin family protein